jgi:hypothetical protein
MRSRSPPGFSSVCRAAFKRPGQAAAGVDNHQIEESADDSKKSEVRLSRNQILVEVEGLEK